jgi:hypothetical protein
MTDQMRKTGSNMTTYKTFKFDHVFKHTNTQEQVYEQADISFYVHQVIEVS